jgi:hypothetical protein
VLSLKEDWPHRFGKILSDDNLRLGHSVTNSEWRRPARPSSAQAVEKQGFVLRQVGHGLRLNRLRSISISCKTPPDTR